MDKSDKEIIDDILVNFLEEFLKWSLFPLLIYPKELLLKLHDKFIDEQFQVRIKSEAEMPHFSGELFDSPNQAALAFILTYKQEGSTEKIIGCIIYDSFHLKWFFTQGLTILEEKAMKNNIDINVAITAKISQYEDIEGFYAIVSTVDLDVECSANKYFVDNDVLFSSGI